MYLTNILSPLPTLCVYVCGGVCVHMLHFSSMNHLIFFFFLYYLNAQCATFQNYRMTNLTTFKYMMYGSMW